MFMNIAKCVAENSTAERLKVGAICVHENENQIISIGYNGTPAGWNNKCEDNDNKTLEHVIHAEANMLGKICQSSVSAKNSTIFITHSPCIECSKLMYIAGVKKVFYNTEYRCKKGIDFLKNCGILVEQF
jgi:dCMP deaminase